MIRLAAMMLAAVAIATSGCHTGQPGGSHAGMQSSWTGPLPTYDEVARAYNTRVDPLSRLSVAIVLRLSYRDAEGLKHDEQVEGSCHFVRPRQLLLSLDKVGQPIAMLGSNQDQFWWFELANHKRALVGEHDRVSPDRLAAAGVPVHPLDLIELMGFTPLPAGPEVGQVSKSDAGVLQVTLPGRIGSRRLSLAPGDFRPFRIELLGEDGKVAAASDLSKYAIVAIRGAGPEAVHPFIATDAVIIASDGATRGHLELSAPVIDPSRPKAGAFDLNKWLQLKDITDIVPLDRDPTPTGR